MLVKRLRYLIANDEALYKKLMIKEGDLSISYGQFLYTLDLLSNEFRCDGKNKYIHQKSESTLISLLMLFYYTSKGKVYVMLPKDCEGRSNRLKEESLMIVENSDQLIYEIIEKAKENTPSIFSFKDNDTTCDDSNLDQVFLRAYSSGTSGMRKQVERTFKSWLSAFDIQNRIFGITCDTKAYIKGDINYTGNLNYALAIFYTGARLIVSNKKGVKDIIKYIEKGQIDNTFLVPTVLGLLTRYVDKRNLTKEALDKKITFITAGEKLQEYIYKNIKGAFINSSIIEYYGASEVGHISYSRDDDILNASDCVGKAFDNVSIKIINEKIYTSSPYHAIDHEGYVCAGDFGRFENNQLYIYGRGKKVISRSAKMIDIEEVRRLLSVKLMCECYSHAYEDKKRGQNYYILIKSDLDKEIVEKQSNNILDKYSKPEKIIVVEKLMTKASGKIDYEYYLDYK